MLLNFYKLTTRRCYAILRDFTSNNIIRLYTIRQIRPHNPPFTVFVLLANLLQLGKGIY